MTRKIRLPIDSLQIYFPASLELQRELIKNGFMVPSDPNKKIKTPIPIIYSDAEEKVITTERLIPPEWLNKKPEDFGWISTVKMINNRKRKAFIIPGESVWLNIEPIFDSNQTTKVKLSLDIEDYHLERTSIRVQNPETWKNWIMFYIPFEYIDEILNFLEVEVGDLNIEYKTYQNRFSLKKEVKQDGKEITYFVYFRGDKDSEKIGLPIVDQYSVCLGCFDLAIKYLEIKAQEHRKYGFNIDPSVIGKLKLRLNYHKSFSNMKAGIKIGYAKIEGKKDQIMFKLATDGLIEIKGILKDKIKGKPRGELVDCNHINKEHYIIVDAKFFYLALRYIKDKIAKLLGPSQPSLDLFLKKTS